MLFDIVHPDVIAALHRQLDTLAYAHTAFFTTEIAERLADRMIEDAPPGLSHVYLVSGGSEAIEAALKMARQFFVEIGEPERRHVIARRQAITAIRSARSRSAATPGGGRNSNLC